MSKKVYCYVDETWQDTEGKIFVVSVIVPDDRDKLLAFLSELEITTGKGKLKWGRASTEKCQVPNSLDKRPKAFFLI